MSPQVQSTLAFSPFGLLTANLHGGSSQLKPHSAASDPPRLRRMHFSSGVDNMELERVKSEEWLAYCQIGLQVPIFLWVKTEIEKG